MIAYFNKRTGDTALFEEPNSRLEALDNWVRVQEDEPLPAVEPDGVLSRQPLAVVPARIVVPPVDVTPDPPAGGDGDVYDPADHKVEDVLGHLADADAGEALRILDAEAAGRARAGIVGQRDAVLAGKSAAESGS